MTTARNQALSQQQVEHYQRDGFLFPVPVFSEAETAQWAAEVEDFPASAAIAGHPVPWNQKAYLLLPSLDGLVRDPRLTSRVASLLGDDLLVLSADLFVKSAHATRRITWHQDVNYWQLEPLDLVTAWVALTPATPANGCMRYAAGRHRDRVAHVERPGAENMLSRGQEIAVAIDEQDAVDVVLRAGEVSFHHPLAPHASGPNVTDRPRIGFAIRYGATAVKQLAGPPITARLARGRDTHGHFGLERGPEGPLSPAALQQHLDALLPHRETQFSTV